MILSKQQILAADDLKREIVQVPEWGGEVIVASMQGCDRDAYEAECAMLRGNRAELMANFRAKLVARCLVDEQGERQFSDDEIVALGKKSALALSRVFDAAQILNGLREKDIEDLKGN